MASIGASRVEITVQEMQTGSAASESTMNRVGGDLNLLLTAGPIFLHWTANGPYSNGGTPQTRVDGERMLMDNCKLVGFFLHTETAGSAGTLEIDILRRTTGGSSATIFSTTPKILFSSGNNSRIGKDFRDSTVLWTATGATQAALSISSFLKGEVLSMNINGIQTGGQDFDFGLFFRLE